MPKKRHPTQYTKPPTTAPASLSLSSSSSRSNDRHERSVNELLANLRRGTLNSNPNATPQSVLQHASPSVPPDLRNILQIPETPGPAPRRLQRRLINGRRGPPGPPPPRSWISLSQSRYVTDDGFVMKDPKGNSTLRALPLPGAYYPGDRSLVATVLRHMAADWEQQRDWNRFYLYTLPSYLRTALLTCISDNHEPGVTAKDLRLILSGPPSHELEAYGVQPPDLAILNEDVRDLDLAGSIGRAISIKELGDVLFPPQKPIEAETAESWDAPELIAGPVCLLPNLTRLSLAVDPTARKAPSWKQLLAIAGKLNSVTHLSLVGWPEPSLTPNAKFTKVISPNTGQSVQYGGTGAYSHTLDNDWTEATLVLRRLSSRLYSLENLDLSGCADWFPALKHVLVDGNSECIDWAGDWGKITMLRLSTGYALPKDPAKAQIQRFDEWTRTAMEVERHIRAQRGGRGKWITVERDVLPDYAKKRLEWDALQHIAQH